MNSDSTPEHEKHWTAAELRKLPAQQRDAVLETAASIAEEIYRNDAQLTDFEAFGEEDLYGECRMDASSVRHSASDGRGVHPTDTETKSTDRLAVGAP